MLNPTIFLAFAPASAQTNPILAFLPMIIIFAVFYMLLIRPQQKQQKELAQTVQNLKKGDRITTSGGIIGTIMGIQNDYIILKVGDGDTKIEILKTAVTGKRS